MQTTRDQSPAGAASGSADEPSGTMRAITQDQYGSADVLTVSTIDLPTAEADEVLIEVHAAGLDRGTWHLMTGLPYLVRLAGFGVTKPKNPVPGLDVAGRVIAVGDAVTRFEVGDEVFGIANGSFAQYTTASEDKLAHKPANLTFEQAAVAAISGITALQALTDIGHVEAGQRVLVIGASGGVGTYAVQLAKVLGAEVTAVAAGGSLDMISSIGADHVIDYTSDDFVDGVTEYDLILDIGGRNSVTRLRSALAEHGTLVIVGGEDGNRITGGAGRQVRAMMLSPFVKQRMTTFISKEHFTFIEQLAEYLQSGAVVPVIGQSFELAGAPQAIHLMETGQASGKSVIVVRSADDDSA